MEDNINLIKGYSKLNEKQVNLLFLKAQIKNNLFIDEVSISDTEYDVDKIEDQIDKKIENELCATKPDYSNVDLLLSNNPYINDLYKENKVKKEELNMFYDYYDTLGKIDKIEHKVMESLKGLNIVLNQNESEKEKEKEINEEAFEKILLNIKEKIKETEDLIEGKQITKSSSSINRKPTNEEVERDTSIMSSISNQTKNKSKSISLKSKSFNKNNESSVNNEMSSKFKLNPVSNEKSSSSLSKINKANLFSAVKNKTLLPISNTSTKNKLIKKDLFSFDPKQETGKYDNKDYLNEIEKKLNEVMDKKKASSRVFPLKRIINKSK